MMLDERLLVAVAVVVVLDLVVVGRAAAQAHDLVHRRDALRADLDAAEAVRAVVDAVRVLGEVAQPLLGLAVARVADEAVGLGERGRPDELAGRPPATGSPTTQAPQWMQAIDWVTSIIDSAGTMYSRSGGSPSGSSHGTTRWTFFQWTASMSTIRSLITGMLPIGSTTIGAVAGASPAASPSVVLQASAGLPLMRTPQEPQIAAWQEQRMPIEPSSSSLGLRGCRRAPSGAPRARRRSPPVGGLARTRGRSGGSSGCSRASQLT